MEVREPVIVSFCDQSWIPSAKRAVGNALVNAVYSIDEFCQELMDIYFSSVSRSDWMFAATNPDRFAITEKIVGLIQRLFDLSAKVEDIQKGEQVNLAMLTKNDSTFLGAVDPHLKGGHVSTAFQSKPDLEFMQEVDPLLDIFQGVIADGAARNSDDEKYRTLYSLLALKWAFTGNPENAEHCQRLGLSSEQYKTFLDQMGEAFGKRAEQLTGRDGYLMLVTILYQDAFKMEGMLALIFDKEEERTVQNHDRAFLEACKILLNPSHPKYPALKEKLPLLDSLSASELCCIKRMWEKSVTVPQLIQGESTKKSAEQFRVDRKTMIQINPETHVNILLLYRIIDWFDAVGHRGAKENNETDEARLTRISEKANMGILFSGMSKIREAILKGKGSIYENYLDAQSEAFALWGKDPGHLFTRLLCMLRKKDADAAKSLIPVLQQNFPPADLQSLMERQFYYTPDLMLAAEAMPGDPLQNVVMGVKLLMKIDEEAKKISFPIDRPLNVQEAAILLKRAKNEEVSFDAVQIAIDPVQGIVRASLKIG